MRSPEAATLSGHRHSWFGISSWIIVFRVHIHCWSKTTDPRSFPPKLYLVLNNSLMTGTKTDKTKPAQVSKSFWPSILCLCGLFPLSYPSHSWLPTCMTRYITKNSSWPGHLQIQVFSFSPLHRFPRVYFLSSIYLLLSFVCFSKSSSKLFVVRLFPYPNHQSTLPVFSLQARNPQKLWIYFLGGWSLHQAKSNYLDKQYGLVGESLCLTRLMTRVCSLKSTITGENWIP